MGVSSRCDGIHLVRLMLGRIAANSEAGWNVKTDSNGDRGNLGKVAVPFCSTIIESNLFLQWAAWTMARRF
jgi:hypothetical protein